MPSATPAARDEQGTAAGGTFESLRSVWPTNNAASLIDHDQFDRVARAPCLDHLRGDPVDLRERNRLSLR
jgi:hypothetical protein